MKEDFKVDFTYDEIIDAWGKITACSEIPKDLVVDFFIIEKVINAICRLDDTNG